MPFAATLLRRELRLPATAAVSVPGDPARGEGRIPDMMLLWFRRPAVDVLVSLLPRRGHRGRSRAGSIPRSGVVSPGDPHLFGYRAAGVGRPVTGSVDRYPAPVDKPTAPQDRPPAWTARQRTVSCRRYRDQPMNTDR